MALCPPREESVRSMWPLALGSVSTQVLPAWKLLLGIHGERVTSKILDAQFLTEH